MTVSEITEEGIKAVYVIQGRHKPLYDYVVHNFRGVDKSFVVLQSMAPMRLTVETTLG